VVAGLTSVVALALAAAPAVAGRIEPGHAKVSTLSATSSALPFTGISVAALLGAGVILVAAGLALRRLAPHGPDAARPA
jgi:hypothetical protein